jgi:ribonucleoside-triphosphate reductase
MNNYESFIHLSRYSRFLEAEGRRETWEETVNRLIGFWKKEVSDNVITDDEFQQLTDAVYNREVMPSMRAMWAAGDALSQNPFRGYNCSFTAIDHIRSFDEILYILMSGTGVGFSAESQYVNKLPIINDTFTQSERTITIEDSAEGWAKALRKLIAELYLGNTHAWDFSKIRPEGARLKTMGGRASGPEPLKDLLAFVTAVFKNAAGRKLTPQEVHDIVCKIAEVVVVGGVRRSALISLSDLSDPEVRDCKSDSEVESFLLLKDNEDSWEYTVTYKDKSYGKRSLFVTILKDPVNSWEKDMIEGGKIGWWRTAPHRALANNSAAYEQKPSMAVFMDEWVALMKSGSGERGIFNRAGAKALAPERRNSDLLVGTNPCAEIQLRSEQVCNLSEVICRVDDTEEDLKRKIGLSAILGTLQASLTEFKYVRKVWQENCEEERLLGVSLTGIQDCKILRKPDPAMLERLRDYTGEVNIAYSKKLGINPATAITTIKPSGTVSQLVDSSSGIHGRFSPYYIRTVRQANNDPLTTFMKEAGVPNEPDQMNPDKTTIFSFPIKSPEGATLANEQTAIEQLENWLLFQKHWSEHSVSVTVYVKEDEWMTVGDWCYQNFDYITGVSFLPYSEHTYAQAPYQPCSAHEYQMAVENMPEIDFTKLSDYEKEDNTEGAQQLACTGGACEIL